MAPSKVTCALLGSGLIYMTSLVMTQDQYPWPVLFMTKKRVIRQKLIVYFWHTAIFTSYSSSRSSGSTSWTRHDQKTGLWSRPIRPSRFSFFLSGIETWFVGVRLKFNFDLSRIKTQNTNICISRRCFYDLAEFLIAISVSAHGDVQKKLHLGMRW